MGEKKGPSENKERQEERHANGQKFTQKDHFDIVFKDDRLRIVLLVFLCF
jgi:hypothetical protein